MGQIRQNLELLSSRGDIIWTKIWLNGAHCDKTSARARVFVTWYVSMPKSMLEKSTVRALSLSTHPISFRDSKTAAVHVCCGSVGCWSNHVHPSMR